MSDKYKIEKNVAMATKRLFGGFPFAEMEVGDSFAFTELPQTVGYLAAVFARRQEPKRKFKVGKSCNGEYRCWRLA